MESELSSKVSQCKRSLSRKSLRLAVKSQAWQPTQSEWMLAAQCVQSEEKARIGKFVFQKDCKSAMIGRLLIRAASAHMLNIAYPDIKLTRTERGKPQILNTLPADYQHYSFNISHQEDFVVLAAEKEREVGVDVMNSISQRGDSMPKFFSLMKRHLTDREWTTVTSQPTEREQMKMFYRHWCLKESVVKTLGIGIGYEFGKLDFRIQTTDLQPNHIVQDTTVHIEGKLDTDWSFEETMLEDHCAVVAIRNQQNNNQSKETNSRNSFHLCSVPELLTCCVPLAGSSPDLEYWKTFSAKLEKPVRMS
ncbi:hypothetical protein SNE40_016115 [Patella caerulea]|uniref:L-aminoadipate-semialdehyde dehydrogenase-phosphopantetheinyl transferase n=1 Tax=Patella caerulea TaxID=87958 RepID=A0AAN8JCP3_PATCE